MKPFHVPIVIAFSAALGASIALFACLDTNAIDFVPKPGASAPLTDASFSDADADYRRPCQICAEGPDDGGAGGCATEIAACTADPICAQIYGCAIAHLCLEKTSQHDSVACGVPCAEEAGVLSTTDPAVTLVLGVTECVSGGPCASICAADAGGGP